MADRELMQLVRKPLLLEEVSRLDIDIDERRLHIGNVELALAVGTGADAAIGDHQRAAVGEELNIVRLHAVRGELADLPVAVGRIAHTDDAAPARVVVLGRVKQPAVSGEGAVAEEMAVWLRGEPDGRTGVERDRHAEASWPSCEGHPFAAVRLERDIVAAAGKLDRADIAALQIEQSRGIGAAIVPACGSEALRLEGGGGLSRQRQRGGAPGEGDQKRAAVDLHRLISIHGVEAEAKASAPRDDVAG